MPTATFTHSAVASAPPAQAWLAIDRPSTWEGVAGVDRVVDPVFDLNNRLIGFSFETNLAGSVYRGKATPRERVEGRLMAWNIVSPHVKGFAQVAFTPGESDTTDVEVTVEVESIGFLAGMMFSTISAAVGNGLERTVQEFAEALANQPS